MEHPIIYENNNFIVKAFTTPTPHVDRDDGGHIMIEPKIRVVDRQQLSPKLAIEVMRLTMIVGEAMAKVMNEHGVDVGRINYQDMGSWSVFKPEGPYFHIQVYGRAKSAKYNKYGDSVYLPQRADKPEWYAQFKPLNNEDIEDIGKEIIRLLSIDKYSDKQWGLSS